MARNDRWSKEQSSASSSYRTLPMWMLQIERKGRSAATTTVTRVASAAGDAKKEVSQQSGDSTKNK